MVRLGCCSHELQIRYFNFSAIFLDWKILASWGSCRIHLLNYLAIISLHICISPSIHPSIYPPRHPPTYPPTLSPICLSPATSIHSPIHPLTHLSIIHDPSIHPSVQHTQHNLPATIFVPGTVLLSRTQREAFLRPLWDRDIHTGLAQSSPVLGDACGSGAQVKGREHQMPDHSIPREADHGS